MTTVTGDRRQAGLTALYLGVFATIWFSVPKADPPHTTMLVGASSAALLTAVAGLGLVLRSRGAGRAPRDPAIRARGSCAVGSAGGSVCGRMPPPPTGLAGGRAWPTDTSAACRQ